MAVGWSIRQSAKFNSPPNFPAIRYIVGILRSIAIRECHWPFFAQMTRQLFCPFLVLSFDVAFLHQTQHRSNPFPPKLKKSGLSMFYSLGCTPSPVSDPASSAQPLFPLFNYFRSTTSSLSFAPSLKHSFSLGFSSDSPGGYLH